jgi:putative transposase
LKRVDRAFDNFFSRVKKGEKPGYPRYRPRPKYRSFTFPQVGKSFRLIGNKLHLSKIGKVKVHLSRPIEGRIKTCTIIREADGWYATFAVEEPAVDPLSAPGESVGIDLGIENFATLSTGEVIGNPEYLRAAEARLKTAQRKVSRRKRGSRRREKAVRLLTRQHLKVKRQRADFHHKTARRLVNEFGVIVVEDLNIKGMVKNHHLAKSISDAGWNQFIVILESKAQRAGQELIKVNPSFTSQDCSRCGERVRKTLAIREHRCIACGLVMHRDHNAAINIKERAKS